MKFKNIYTPIIYILFIISINNIYASLKIPQEVSQAVKDKSIQWNFELYNKHPDPILFFLKTSEEQLALAKLGSGGKIRLAIDKNFIRNLTLSVWVSSDNAYGLKSALDMPKEERGENELELIKDNPPTIKVKINNKNAMTVFLTFDNNNQIRPQTGKLNGILGVTHSGLSLRNNINKNSIFKQ